MCGSEGGFGGAEKVDVWNWSSQTDIPRWSSAVFVRLVEGLALRADTPTSFMSACEDLGKQLCVTECSASVTGMLRTVSVEVAEDVPGGLRVVVILRHEQLHQTPAASADVESVSPPSGVKPLTVVPPL